MLVCNICVKDKTKRCTFLRFGLALPSSEDTHPSPGCQPASRVLLFNALEQCLTVTCMCVCACAAAQGHSNMGVTCMQICLIFQTPKMQYVWTIIALISESAVFICVLPIPHSNSSQLGLNKDLVGVKAYIIHLVVYLLVSLDGGMPAKG